MLAVEVVHELLIAVTSILVVTLPILIRQHYTEKRLHEAELKTLGRIEEVYLKVNGVEEKEADTVAMLAEIRAGFARLEGAASERVERHTDT